MRTNIDNGLHDERPANLLSNLQGGNQVWQAVATIAEQLKVLANAQKGEGDFFPIGISPPTQTQPALTFNQLTNLLLLSKARAERSERYLRALRGNLLKFSESFGNVVAATIEIDQLEEWIDEQNVSARTKKNYVGDLRLVFGFGVKRRLLL